MPTPTLQHLRDIERTIDRIYQELDIQMKRMSQIQLQLDEVRGKVKLLFGNSNSR